MSFGDIPCGLVCHTDCIWNNWGICRDNCVCERRTLEPDERPDYDDDTEEED